MQPYELHDRKTPIRLNGVNDHITPDLDRMNPF